MAAKTRSPSRVISSTWLRGIGRQQPHERFEVVDAAPAGARIATILRIGKRIAQPHLAVRHAECRLDGEQVVGDSHLVAVRVGANASSVACCDFQPNRPTRRSAGATSITMRRASAHAIAIAVEGILQREHRVVGDRLDQAGAEQRDRRPARDDVHIIGNLRLAAVVRHREHVNQRVVCRVQAPRVAVVVAVAGAQFEDDAATADGRHAVAHRAARAVEGRAETLLGGLDFREVLEPETELAELHRREARQRRARERRLRLRAGVQEQRRAPRHEQQAVNRSVVASRAGRSGRRMARRSARRA